MPDKVPFRLELMKRLTAALEEITEENGYQHDLRDKVFRGREVFGHKDPLPMVSILDAITEREQLQPPPGGESTHGLWEILVQGFVDDDIYNPTDPGHYLMAEVKKKLNEINKGTRDPSMPGVRNILGFGSRIDNVHFGAGVVRPQDDLSDKAYFWLRVTIEMTENHQDPYAYGDSN